MIVENVKIRIKNERHGEKVQKVLFKLGCVWKSGEKAARFVFIPFLFVSNNVVSCGNSEYVFNNTHSYKEVKLKDLKNMMQETNHK